MPTTLNFIDEAGSTLCAASQSANPPGMQPGESADDSWVGRCLTKYRIVAPLARGGMGIVYLGEDMLLRRPVAVKRIGGGIAQTLREARCAARVHHANVVAINDFVESQGVHFLVSEYVPGVSCHRFLQRATPMCWQDATRLVIEACKGIAGIHAARIIHCDIKPANILVSCDGVVKITDFGLANDIADETHLHGRTRPLAGTPHYMSPEQARNESLDERTDLYSLGATYFALLTGEPPFVGKDDYATMYAHATMLLPDPRKICPHLPESCVRILRPALAKRRADRYSTANAMLADLQVMVGDDRRSLAHLVSDCNVATYSQFHDFRTRHAEIPWPSGMLAQRNRHIQPFEV